MLMMSDTMIHDSCLKNLPHEIKSHHSPHHLSDQAKTPPPVPGCCLGQHPTLVRYQVDHRCSHRLRQLHCQNMGINDAWRKAFEESRAGHGRAPVAERSPGITGGLPGRLRFLPLELMMSWVSFDMGCGWYRFPGNPTIVLGFLEGEGVRLQVMKLI